MATDLENLSTFKSNLLAAAAAWTGSGLKEVSITSPTGKSVTYRSLTEIMEAVKRTNELINAESPDITYSQGY